MYVDSGMTGYPSATLVHCVLEGNSAGSGGGLMVSGGTATLYGCTFASNTAGDIGPDIYNYGTVSVYGDAADFTSGCTQGTSLSINNDGTISGSPFSFSGCTETHSSTPPSSGAEKEKGLDYDSLEAAASTAMLAAGAFVATAAAVLLA